jgi:hypothetical protein
MEAIFYFIFIHFSLLIPGYVLLYKLKLFDKYPGITLILGYLVSIALFAGLAVSYYLLNVPYLVVQIIFWASLVVGLFFFVYERIYLQLIKQWFILASFGAMSLFGLCFIALGFPGSYTIIPDPEPRADRNYHTLNIKVLNVAQTNANDNYIPYRQAQFIVNKSNPAKDSFIEEWGVHFFQRTPLMGAVTAQYFLALGDKPPINYTWSDNSPPNDKTYLKFQIIAQILNSIFIVPAFFLLRKIFSLKTAAASLLFIIPSQFFLYNSFFSWPKSLVAFFILASWLLLISSQKVRYIVAAAITSGMAYLAHDLAVLYIGASFLFLLINRRFRDSLILLGGSAVFALPWLFISSVVYHKPSSFIYYPISTKDIPQPGQIKEVVKEFLSTSPLKLLAIRIESLFYLLTPYQLIVDEGNQTILRRLWAVGLYSIPGSIGFGLVLPVIAFIIKYVRTFKYWILILTPLVLCVIIIGWPKGLGSLHFAQAVVVLLMGMGVSLLLKLRNKIWLIAAYIVCTAQFIYFTMYSYQFGSAVSNFKDGLQLAVIAMIVVGCGGALYLINARTLKSLRLN